MMGREADEPGLESWVGQLKDGAKREDVFNGFAGSNEFATLCEKYGIIKGTSVPVPDIGTKRTGTCAGCSAPDDVEEFVRRMYEKCLGREAEEAGLKDWSDKLRAETISGTSMAQGFFFSEEFISKKYSNADYVEHLYEALMGRASDPAGKADWVSKLANGTTREEVFSGFGGSEEFKVLCKQYGIKN